MTALVDILKEKTPPLSAAILLAATLIYLTIELGFNARLLDVSGTPGDLQALMGIEQWGRLISGFAVALAFWGFIAKAAANESWEIGATVFWTAASTLFIVIFVYWGEKAFLDQEVEKTPPQVRQVGAIGVLLTEYLHEHKNLEGIPVDDAFFESPEGKAFYALFASNYSAVLRNAGGVEEVTRAAINQRIETELGGAAGSYQTIYRAAIDKVGQVYDTDYIDGVKTLSQVVADGAAVADRAWNDYVNELRRRQGWEPTEVPPQHHDDVARNVRSRFGVNVPNGWLPWDREVFQTLVQNEIEAKAKKEWRDKAEAFMPGAALPYSLTSFDSFLAHPAIQRRLQADMAEQIRAQSDGKVQLPQLKTPIADGWDVVRWDQLVYTPMFTKACDVQFDRFVKDSASYQPGAPNYCAGVDAVYALKVPGFALSISVAGAIYHASKVIWYLCYFLPLLRASLFGRWLVRLAFVAALLTVPYAHSSPVLTAEKYSELMEHKAYADGGFSAALNDWIVRAQQVYYPANDFVRRTALSEAEFSKLPLLPVHKCDEASVNKTASAAGYGKPGAAVATKTESSPLAQTAPTARSAWGKARDEDTLAAYRAYAASGDTQASTQEFQAAVRAKVSALSGGRVIETLHLEQNVFNTVYLLPSCSASAGTAGPQSIVGVSVITVDGGQWLAFPTSDKFPFVFMPYGAAFPSYGLAGAIQYPDLYPEGARPTRC